MGEIGVPVTHPEYRDATFWRADVGVVRLDAPIHLAAYAQLPPVGQLDSAHPGHHGFRYRRVRPATPATGGAPDPRIPDPGTRAPPHGPDPNQHQRLIEIRDNLKARIAEAQRERWLGEVEGLQISLAGAEDKLAQIHRHTTAELGIPTIPTASPQAKSGTARTATATRQPQPAPPISTASLVATKQPMYPAQEQDRLQAWQGSG